MKILNILYVSNKSFLKKNISFFKKNKTLIIVTVCRLTKERGLDVLFQALSLLKFKNYKLLIAGDGIEKLRLKQLSEKLNISSKIKYFGFGAQSKSCILIIQANSVLDNGKNKGTFAPTRVLLHQLGAKVLGSWCKSLRNSFGQLLHN